jgi:hypothetical protein
VDSDNIPIPFKVSAKSADLLALAASLIIFARVAIPHRSIPIFLERAVLPIVPMAILQTVTILVNHAQAIASIVAGVLIIALNVMGIITSLVILPIDVLILVLISIILIW